MDYTTRLDENPVQAHVNYECPCGCTAGVMYAQESGTVELGQCCCGRLLWVGDDAEHHVRAAFESDAAYELDTQDVRLPWGESAVAVLAVPKDAAHGSHDTSVITSTVHDLVCHMDIDPKSAVATSQYKGSTYYFCAKGCKLDFDENPEEVLAAEARYDHHQQSSHAMGSIPTGGGESWWQFWKN